MTGGAQEVRGGVALVVQEDQGGHVAGRDAGQSSPRVDRVFASRILLDIYANFFALT